MRRTVLVLKIKRNAQIFLVLKTIYPIVETGFIVSCTIVLVILSFCRYSFSGLQAVIICYARDVEQTSAIDVVISTEN